MIRSRLAQRIMDRGARDRARRVAGEPPGFGEWLASRSAALTIVNWAELPHDQTDGNLQNGSGEFLFLVGFSAVGGPDVFG